MIHIPDIQLIKRAFILSERQYHLSLIEVSVLEDRVCIEEITDSLCIAGIAEII